MAKKSDKQSTLLTPGVNPKVPQPKTVSMRCKRCGENEMEELDLPGSRESGNRTYRCLSCKNMVDVMVGGTFSL